jgi:uncharacterized protein YegL
VGRPFEITDFGGFVGTSDELFDVAPFVLVIDRSKSMEGVMPTLNQFVPQAIETMRLIPEALESAALGIVSFNHDASVVRRMTWIDEDLTWPHLVAGGLTSYLKPLESTLALINKDIADLGDRGLKPVIFFVTDGQQNKETETEWMAARARLLKSPLRPTLITFGFGNVDEPTLRKLASRPDLVETNQDDAINAIKEILNIVTGTVITLTSGGSRGQPGSLASRIIESESGEDDESIDYRVS